MPVVHAGCRTDHDVTHHDLDAGSPCRTLRSLVDDQCRKCRRRDDPLRQRQPAVAHPTPPVVALPARQTVAARHIRDTPTGGPTRRHHPRLLLIRTPPASPRPSDPLQPAPIALLTPTPNDLHFHAPP